MIFKFQFQMESPAVKDLPKLDTQISQEIAKDHNLKKVEVGYFLNSERFPHNKD